jgi:hypothetical protein
MAERSHHLTVGVGQLRTVEFHMFPAVVASAVLVISGRRDQASAAPVADQ